MNDLPSPPDTSVCDLRGRVSWMALYGGQLFGSEWYDKALLDGRGGIAALKLWWEAMLQTPAGSLPDNEVILCRMADFGQDLKTWRKHRDTALHGFRLHSDGRLYHPVVVEKALEAWHRLDKEQHNRDASAQRMRRKRGKDSNTHQDDSEPEDVTRNVTRTDPVTKGVTSGVTYAERDAQRSPHVTPPPHTPPMYSTVQNKEDFSDPLGVREKSSYSKKEEVSSSLSKESVPPARAQDSSPVAPARGTLAVETERSGPTNIAAMTAKIAALRLRIPPPETNNPFTDDDDLLARQNRDRQLIELAKMMHQKVAH